MPFSLANSINSAFFIDFNDFAGFLASVTVSVASTAGAASALGAALAGLSVPRPVISTIVYGCLCPCFFL